jgi:hypothetical protein
MFHALEYEYTPRDNRPYTDMSVAGPTGAFWLPDWVLGLGLGLGLGLVLGLGLAPTTNGAAGASQDGSSRSGSGCGLGWGGVRLSVQVWGLGEFWLDCWV